MLAHRTPAVDTLQNSAVLHTSSASITQEMPASYLVVSSDVKAAWPIFFILDSKALFFQIQTLSIKLYYVFNRKCPDHNLKGFCKVNTQRQDCYQNPRSPMVTSLSLPATRIIHSGWIFLLGFVAFHWTEDLVTLSSPLLSLTSSPIVGSTLFHNTCII